MRKRLLLLCAGTFFLAGQIRAQWVVTDPGNLAQSIINMSDNIVHTSSVGQYRAYLFNCDKYRPEFCGDGEDIPAVQEIL